MKVKNLILGGGLSGISTAYFMRNKKMNDFLVLEKESAIGGLLRSVEVDGYTFDIGGSHIIFSKNKKILNFMLNLLKGNVTKNKRNTKILYKNRLVKYPFENGLSDLPLLDNIKCLTGFIINRIGRKFRKKPENMKDWFYYLFGKQISESYLIPYNRKIWKFPPEKMSTVWVERIPNPPLVDILKSSLGISTEGYKHQLYFYYPTVGGIQALVESMANKIKNSIKTNFEVLSIEKNRFDKWEISNGKETIVGDRLISTIPLPTLIKSIDYVPTKVKKAAKKLKYNSLITVGIGLNNKQKHNLSWVYIPDNNILPHRISFPSNYSKKVAPKNKSSILAEITHRRGDKIQRKSDEWISSRTISDLDSVGFLNENNIKTVVIKRFRFSYIVYDKNYHKYLDPLVKWFNNENILLNGRFGLWKYINMDKVIEESIKTVDMLIKTNRQ